MSFYSSSTRSETRSPYPVVDIFAGPGGLGEGFASAKGDSGKARFRSAVSIEQDTWSHSTLLMRHFFRGLQDGEALEDYYSFLAGHITSEELFSRHPKPYAEATKSALRISLGPETHTLVKDIIGQRLSANDPWVLVGGPPCQAYSLAGRSRMMGNPKFVDDDRHMLYREYLRIIADHRPPVFVMENVKGLLSATYRGVSTINQIVRDLKQPATAIPDAPVELKYKLYSLSQEEVAKGDIDPRMFVLRAEEYGIPQARHRMFIVGIRSDLNVRPSVLVPSDAPTVHETIDSLPKVRSGLSRGRDGHQEWLQAIKEISSICLELDGSPCSQEMSSYFAKENLKEMRFPDSRSSIVYPEWKPDYEALRGIYDDHLPVLTAHEARGHMPSDLRRYFFAASYAQLIRKSPKLADFPATLLPNHKNVEQGRKGKMFADRFRVQLPDQVSTTITSHISKDGHYYIHYDPAQCRSLTVREAARLQTFPDNYYFAGPRTAQYHQVGNAVPPYLSRQIADIIGDLLDAVRNSLR